MEAKPRSRLSLRFLDPEVEAAFLLSRLPKMRRNSLVVAVLIVLCTLPDIWMYTGTLVKGNPSCGRGCPILGERAFTRLLALVVIAVVFLGLIALISLPMHGRFLSARWFEGFWLAWMLVFMEAVCVIAYTDMQSAYCVFEAIGTPDETRLWVTDFKSNCGSCMHSVLFSKATVVLILDMLVTVSHMALPVSWILMLPLDIFVVVTFALLNGNGGSEEFRAAPVFLSALLVLLVGGACWGLRAQELHERDLFEMLTDERVRRAKAEFDAERHSKGFGTPRPRESSSEVPTNSTQRTPADSQRTTRTGRAFEKATRDILDGDAAALGSLWSLGQREGWAIPEEELEVDYTRVLGKGGCGVVLEGKFCCGPVAVKRLAGGSWSEVRTIINEFRILRHVRHPNVILFHGVCFHSLNGLQLVIERVHGTNLEEFISEQEAQKVTPESEQAKSVLAVIADERRCIAQDLCRAMVYLHSRKPPIVHGDIKPRNVMVKRTEDGAQAKLLDFGLSRLMTHRARLGGGTRAFMAPEIASGLEERPYPAADVYSFGKMLRTMASGVLPEWSPIISRCAAADGKLRPTAKGVHNMLSGHPECETSKPSAFSDELDEGELRWRSDVALVLTQDGALCGERSTRQKTQWEEQWEEQEEQEERDICEINSSKEEIDICEITTRIGTPMRAADSSRELADSSRELADSSRELADSSREVNKEGASTPSPRGLSTHPRPPGDPESGVGTRLRLSL